LNPRRGAAALAEAVATATQRLMLRTDRTPLRVLWRSAHEIAIRLVAETLARRGDASVFVKGSFGFGKPVFGVSDVDLVVVVPTRADRVTDARAVESVKRRWRRIVQLFPPLNELFHIFVYDSRSLRDAASAPFVTFGLDRQPPRAGFLGPRPLVDEMGLQERPELYGATREWRLVAGRRSLVPPPPDDIARRRIASWLELQFWWRYVFPACLDPSGPRLPYLCVKLVAEPARIWLWLAHGEQIYSRVEVLERALQRLPEEELAFRRALDLHRALATSPAPPLADMLPHLVRLSSLIAWELRRQLEPAGETAVRLAGATGSAITAHGLQSLNSPSMLPLVDWRARTVPPLPDEVFSITDADPADPAALAAAAVSDRPGEYRALWTEDLLILPAARAEGRGRGGEPEHGSARFNRVKLRGIQCPPTDPVSFALANGETVALFPNAPGWSAHDCANRAVAEHAAWLAGGRRDGDVRGWVAAQTAGAPPAAVSLGRLFTAARAGLFLDSLAEEPELALTVASVAGMLARLDPSETTTIDEAVGRYEAWRSGDGVAPEPHVVDAFASVVAGLPAYDSWLAPPSRDQAHDERR
jgi:predicted nucleotidyltransferase